MEKICSFNINNKIYTIYDINKIKGKESYVGQSQYEKGMIFIEKGSEKNMLITLKHELMHVWLYENGHKNQNGDECFSYEDLCEYSALANNSVNKIVKLYIDSKTN
ncbi:MAG: hypothetical protein IJH55_07600 [Romboutsia sp.]|nr:hypothetical protein [Romboutsia sp.]